jgi:hypothetical protein
MLPMRQPAGRRRLMTEHRTSETFGAKPTEGEASRVGGSSGRSMEKRWKTADSLDDTVRRYIETKPYTTALIALGIGWLMGRSHHPF